jgi:parvulin-like peptidyl-prolyl isomerase
LSRKLKPKPKVTVAKRQPARWQRERTLVLVAWILIPLTIALALGLVGYWSYDTYVSVWHKPVAKINDTVLDMDYYVKMLRLYAMNSGQQVDTTTFPYTVLYDIENSELLKQKTAELGIQVTPEEITTKINSYLADLAGGNSTEGNTTQGNTTQGNTTQGNTTQPTINSEEAYQQWLTSIRLTDSEYRQVVEITLLSDKILSYIKLTDSEYQEAVDAGTLNDKLIEFLTTYRVPSEAKQVHLHAIKVDTEEQASQVRERLLAGEEFAIVALELSQDEESRQFGGDLGWIPQGVLYTEIDDAAFSLPIGNISQSIETSQGFYVIKVSEINEKMPIASSYRDILASNEQKKWLDEQRNASVIIEYLDQDKIVWAMNKIT